MAEMRSRAVVLVRLIDLEGSGSGMVPRAERLPTLEERVTVSGTGRWEWGGG